MIPRPAVAPSPPWAFPLPAVTTLGNGLAVWAYDLPGQYIVTCDLVLELPINAEPPGADGLATLAVRALDEGTTAHPGPAFAAALEDVGAQFTGLVGASTTQCLLDLPYSSLGDGLALLAEAVRSPEYADDDIERIKANRLAEIEQQEAHGSYVAGVALRRDLVAPELRLGRPTGGDAAGVAAITPEQIRAWRAAHYGPAGATLIVAGDLTGIDAAAVAAQAFAGWEPAPVTVRPDVARPGTPTRRLIQRPGAVQADIRLGWYGVDQADPRWADLQVATAIMGGLFTSRANTRLREDLGLTYGVSMSTRPYRSGGLVEFAVSTRTDAAAEVIAETLALLRADPGFTQAEVDDAAGHLSLSAPLGFDTAETVAGQAANLAAGRLGLDHVTATLRRYAEVTPDSAMAAYTALVDPDRAGIVVVADGDVTIPPWP